MKKLVIVRHGEYTDAGEYLNEPLSDSGRVRVAQLAEKLMAHIEGCSVVILSSTALRATQTAEIISKRFGTPFQSEDLLWSGDGGKTIRLTDAFKKVLELIISHQHKFDVVVLVTHYEYVGDFPRFFGRQHLSVNLNGKVIPKGTAWLINCEKKEMVHVQ